MRTLTLALLALGCSIPVWYNPDATVADYYRDHSYCMGIAGPKPIHPYPPPNTASQTELGAWEWQMGQTSVIDAERSQTLRECMMGSGWRLVPKSQIPPGIEIAR